MKQYLLAMAAVGCVAIFMGCEHDNTLKGDEKATTESDIEEAVFRYQIRQRSSLNPQAFYLELDRKELVANRPTTLVAKERAMPRPAYVLVRGEYDKPDMERGELQRRVPAWLPPMDESLPKNRLGLAQWLVSDRHPSLSLAR